jgi:hypothetical protein
MFPYLFVLAPAIGGVAMVVHAFDTQNGFYLIGGITLVLLGSLFSQLVNQYDRNRPMSNPTSQKGAEYLKNRRQ